MDTATRTDFQRLAAKDGYFRGTEWDHYLSDVVKAVAQFNFKPSEVLEIGPYKLPLVKRSTILDRRNFRTGHRLIQHRADHTPWPIRDDQYRLIVASAVWEHLLNAQQEAWREAVRVGDFLVWLVPFLWESGPDKYHVGIDWKTIERWTLGSVPLSSKILGKSPWQLYLGVYDLRPSKAALRSRRPKRAPNRRERTRGLRCRSVWRSGTALASNRTAW